MQLVKILFYALSFKFITINKIDALNSIHAFHTYYNIWILILESLPHLSVQFDPDSEVPTPPSEEHDIFYAQKEENIPKYNYKNI